MFLASHPFGLQTDASQHLLKNSPPAHPTFPIKYMSGGTLETIEHNNCVNYVKNTFLRESDKENIIVPHLEQLDQNSFNYKITLGFEEVFSAENNFLLTSVNFYDHLEKIGYSKKELEDQFEGHLKDLSNVLVLYPAEFPAVIIITLPESEKDTINDLLLKANANVKAYQILHHHRLIEKEGFVIINAIGAAFHEKETLSSYCKLCEENCLFISKDDFEQESWWKELKGIIEKVCNTRKYNNDTNFSRETASLLMIFAALIDDRFPTLSAEEDERINKMVLNKTQRNILLDSSPKKIIIGK